MEKNVLRAIDGIALYPLISLSIFGVFFLALLTYVLLVRRNFIDQMAQLPLAADDADPRLTFTPTRHPKGGTPC